MSALNENRIDRLFRAAAEATGEAVVNSMCAAEAMRGWAGISGCRWPIG
ncbi:L-aminopeptidase/D-esterase-like protein [Aminobacter aganoensis]|uniref:L-aminopeptidase/D-esterase-like protein n=1 Tax=Aminobacter aganoensis TaxID=83264 RepID=A0A7X0F5V2_9HYPH|nr:L-aminopeptidase/D-esterase-like protein [Aminobacter aganoensis]